MKPRWLTYCGMIGLVALAGCGALSDLIDQILTPKRTRIRLVNNTPFPVEVDLYYSDTQEAPREIIVALGEEVLETVAAGDVLPLTLDCDELQAVVIDDADLRIVGGIGPEEDTEVLRDGDDFGCGDTITFTFTSTTLGTEFTITTRVE